MGGKSRLSNQILDIFPKHICYVEPFCGGASIFLKKQPSKVEVINDIDGELINFYRCVQHHPEELSKQSISLLHSRESFNRLRIIDLDTLTDIQRAARYYAINKMSFASKMDGSSFGYGRTVKARLSAVNFERDIKLVTKRLNKVYIENIGWDDCVSRYDSEGALIYCDPPYFGTYSYGTTFDYEQYEMMAGFAKDMKGKMIISVNDIPEMREVFDGLNFDVLDIKYSVNTKRKVTQELLIRNF